MMKLPDKGKIYYTDSEDDAYETVFQLRSSEDRNDDVPMLLRRAKDMSRQKLWQLLGYRTKVYFNTFSQAQAYCQRRGWRI